MPDTYTPNLNLTKVEINGSADTWGQKLNSNADAIDTAVAAKVAKAGDTMTGPLTLSGAPTVNLHAATKAYVDTGLGTKAATAHTHAISDVTGLQTAIDGKAALAHTHAISDVTGLQTALDGKVVPGLVTGSGLTMATARLLGRTTAATGAVEEVSTGTGLALSGGTLAAAAGVVVGRAYAEYATYATLTAQIPLDDTIPQITEGTEILSVSITPKSATNRVQVRVTVHALIQDSANRTGIVAIFRNGGADAIAARSASLYAGGAQVAQGVVLEFEDVPGSTTAQTYTVRVGPTGGTMYLNGSSSNRTLGGVQRATAALTEFVA